MASLPTCPHPSAGRQTLSGPLSVKESPSSDRARISAPPAPMGANASNEAPARIWRARPTPLIVTPPPYPFPTPGAPRRGERVVSPYFPTPPSPTDAFLQQRNCAMRTFSEREDEGYGADASSFEFSEDSRELPALMGPTRRLSFEGRLSPCSPQPPRSVSETSTAARSAASKPGELLAACLFDPQLRGESASRPERDRHGGTFG